MTLDDFLRTLETLIEERETHDDDPGEGNFGCEDCRNCNHCRFCIGCDSCEDCTYCEECLDCTSCTQSKRCVSCEKVSYCEDCRDCKSSRYLTLCVSCNDCVHCLGCVGLEGAEFYVLNQKRTRKEYFALLRQVQELMAARMIAGWRPPGIGLASEILDAITAGRDSELSAAPWLEELREVEVEPAAPVSDPWAAGRRELPADEYEPPRRSREYERSAADRRPDREYDALDRAARWPDREVDEFDRGARRVDREVDEYDRSPVDREARWRDREADAPDRGPVDRGARRVGREVDEYDRSRVDREARWRDREVDAPERGPVDRGARRPDREVDAPDRAARWPDRGYDEPERAPAVDRGARRAEYDEYERGARRVERELDRGDAVRRAAYGYDDHDAHDDRPRRRELASWDRPRDPDEDDDAPQPREQLPTRPFTGRRLAREPGYDAEAGRPEPEPEPELEPELEPDEWDDRPRARERRWEDSRERTVARARLPVDPRGEVPRSAAPAPMTDDDDLAPDVPNAHAREASSPWIDDAQAQARRRAKRGSLRRAGRPTRKPDDEPSSRDATGTGSFRTGSAPARGGGGEGTHTGTATGLRLGRKPKR